MNEGKGTGSDNSFYFAAHQLRAPMVGLQTVLRALLHGGVNDPEKMESLLEQAYRRSEDMMKVLNDILNLGEARSAYESLAGGTSNPSEVLREVLETIAPLAGAKSVSFDATVEETPEIPLGAEAAGHVFMNLVENAVKYNRDGGRVEVFLAEENGEMVFRVKDEGIGIPEGWGEKVFSDFIRADNARKQEKQGTGLGLSIVKTLVERAGGSVGLKSKSGEGTEFEVKLPFAKQ